MALNLGQWAAIATVIAVHAPNPNLTKAVDAELTEARKDHETCPAAPQEERRVEGDG